MAKKKVKVEETKVVLPEEVVMTEMAKEEEPVEVMKAIEDNGLLKMDTVVEENKQEDVSVETVECNEMETVENENKQEEIVETEEGNSLEPVEVEANMVEESIEKENTILDTEEKMQNTNESLTVSIEDKEAIIAVTPMVFRSDSEEARYYILEFLKDGESHKKSEIVTCINEKARKNFSDSVIINTLRNLVNAGDLMQLERGSYQSGSGIGLASKLLLFISNTKQGLDKITTMSLSDIKAEDLVVIDDVKKLKDMLNSMYEKLGTN